MKRTALRRRAQLDPVTSEVRATVLVRDRACVAYLIDRRHVCRDVWGNVHAPGDLAKLTLEHVKDTLRAGKRAPSDPAHLVALCGLANDRVPTKAQRLAFREYLARQDAPEHPHVEFVHGCTECDTIRRRLA